MKKILAMLAGFLACAALGATPSFGANASKAGSGAANETGEYKFSVVDVELPSAVFKRAQEVLGKRLVDISISQDQSHYVLGILDLRADEVTQILLELQSKVELRLEPRGVASEATDALRKFLESLRGVPRGGCRDVQFQRSYRNCDDRRKFQRRCRTSRPGSDGTDPN